MLCVPFMQKNYKVTFYLGGSLLLIHCIQVLYSNVSSCVMNNDFTTAPFTLGGRIRQGDPLSPYLFIITLEKLAEWIRSDSKIHGFRIGEEMVKLSLFANNMTCFLRDKDSYDMLFQLLQCFKSDYSMIELKTWTNPLNNQTHQ